jgi:N-acetylglutamate synthase-like GNAT family acetyltransferase
MIEIVSYQRKFQPDFKRLNLEWLDTYHLTETHDLEILDHPEEKVIAGGGCIFLALDGEKVIGTAGLVKAQEEIYELVKMTVDPGWQGRGISKILLDRCLVEARKLKAKKIFLFSNSQLLTAIKLYEKYGFRKVAVTNSPMLTADVKMELRLTQTRS